MASPALTYADVAALPGLRLPHTETYYPTVETSLRVASTTVGLSLFYETGFVVEPEQLRFAFSAPTADHRRVLTIEIEYSHDPSCPSEL
ncbi:hypothetical protein EJV47_01660 [Hymenobacter gummosus]|uniref:Uncharacterized protein n=1 Tax=Hymenobacter gummosus TaxID=1776032 RepID=A0A3S0H8M7_9BACT|nr:hypothetical protein [Hymenobacter gummosus]RTQ53472.1 hypothetical protein EJV47_01660 [Hymenobacter gummosus]